MTVYTLLATNARPEPVAVLDGVGATLNPDSSCLETDDGDTSYAVFERHGASSPGNGAENSVLWTAEAPPAGLSVTRAEIVVHARYDIGADGFDSLQAGWLNADGSVSAAVWSGFGTQPFITAAYAEYRGDVDPATLMATGGADLSGVTFYAGFATGRTSDTMRITYAAVVLTGDVASTDPVIDSVTPNPVSEGATFTINGSNLAPVARAVAYSDVLGYDMDFPILSTSDTEVVIGTGWASPLAYPDGTSSVEVTDLHVVTPSVDSNMASFVIDAPPPTPTSSGGSWGSYLEVTTKTEGRGPSGLLGVPPADQRDGSLIRQRQSVFTRLTPALVIAGIPVQEPLMSGISTSSASIATPNITEELQAALAVNLGATWRWLPGDSYVASGDGFAWHTSQGGAHDLTAPDVAHAPYVDPAFVLPTRHGDKEFPALIFDGGQYLSTVVAHRAAFTVAMVVRMLHSPDNNWYDLVSSPSAATDAVKGTDLTLRRIFSRIIPVINDHRYADIELEMWARGSSATESMKRRPAIFVWSCNQTYSRFGVLDVLGRTIVVKRINANDLPAATFDLNFYFGRNGAVYSSDSTAHIQLFDLALWDNIALNKAQIRYKLWQLNGVYGVHR